MKQAGASSLSKFLQCFAKFGIWHPRLKYRSIAVEQDSSCYFDSFHFEWIGNDGESVTPERCDCFGDGCDSSLIDPDYSDDYYDSDYRLGPDRFSVDSSNFTFYFESDSSIDNGHVVFDWECVKL